MVSGPRNAVSFGKTVLRGIKEENVTFMAASIAYQAFVSLIPLLVLVFFLVSVVGDEGLAAQVTQTTEGFLPEAGNELLEDAIEGSVASTGASVIGLVTLLWGSLKIFRSLDTAFSEIYETTGEGSLVDQLRDAFVVFAAIGVALVAAAVATGVFAILPDSPLLGVLNPLLLVGALTLAFTPMYYYFPDVDVGVREVLPGVVVAAVGWAALQGLFQVYVAVAADSESAGPFGAILLLLTWLYFGGLVLLIGGVVNAARGGHLSAAADAPESDESAVRERESERRRRDRERLEDRVAELEREMAMLENDLDAQRSRRYRLEDRTTALARENRRLADENERLRREVERRRDSRVRGVLERVFERAARVNVGRVRRS